MRADLHTHTNNSDGVLSVREAVALAKERGLDVLAITDHDVLKGALEAENFSSRELKIIVGLELSTDYHDESVHILGYFRSGFGLEGFDAFLSEQRENRIKRAHKIKAKLLEHFNIDLDMGFVKDVSSVTRGTIAREIIRQGYPYTPEEIFGKMIGNGCPAYLPSTKMDPRTGIEMIHAYGGLAVLAHPVLLQHSNPEEIIAFGIDGIEAVYPANKPGDEEKIRGLAERYGLFVTGGSDFHAFGDTKHGELGAFGISGRDLEIFLNKLGVER